MSTPPPSPTAPRLFAANELLAFLVEIVALVILADWGWHHGEPSRTRLLQAIGAPLLAAVVWGLFAAPRARFAVPLAAQLTVKALVFGAAVWALLDLRLPTPAMLLALVVTVNPVAGTVWRRRGYTLAPPRRP